MDDAAAVPDEAVGADAHQHVAAHRPAGDRHAVGAARHADITADRPARKDDRVVAEAGDEVAVDDPARHVEEIVGKLHIDAADPPAGHPCRVAVVEGIHDAAAGHLERIHRTALIEPVDLAARHDKVVNAFALLHLAGDGPGANREAVVAIALVNRALDPARIDDDDVGAAAEVDVAREGAGAAGREGELVVSARIVEPAHGRAAVADMEIVTRGGRKDALRKGGRGLSKREGGDGRQEYRPEGLLRGHGTSLPYRVGAPLFVELIN